MECVTSLSNLERCFCFSDCMSLMIKSWGSHVDLVDEWEMGQSLSLALSPDHEILEPSSGAHLGASSDQAEEISSLGEMDFECAASECLSCDDRSYDELLELITRTVDSLQLYWPQELETPRR